MLFSVKKVRYALIGLLGAAGLALAPSAFARSHVSVGINFGVPGVSLGYSNYGWGGGYAFGGYYPAYAPVFYGPSYYRPAYYGPTYYRSYRTYGPAYGVVYSNSYPTSRGHYRGPSRAHHRGDYGRRAHYYDRSGYRGR